MMDWSGFCFLQQLLYLELYQALYLEACLKVLVLSAEGGWLDDASCDELILIEAVKPVLFSGLLRSADALSVFDCLGCFLSLMN
tara:strand:+ start:4739 stop:4990 length:252 start_codon:yes stop_codon:yes gene_type:complete